MNEIIINLSLHPNRLLNEHLHCQNFLILPLLLSEQSMATLTNTGISRTPCTRGDRQ